jgi:hypothetical protein
MKKWIFLATMMTLMSLSVKAQFDDVYYDPARDSRPTATTTRSQTPQPRYEDNTAQSRSDDEYYDNGSTGGDYYEYDEDYDDYKYSTRIRRFHRPYSGFNYYSDAYVDYGYYDPNYYNRFNRGVTIIVGNGYWNRWNSFNRWNNWSWFNNYWDDWRYSSYGFCNPNYYAGSFYPSWGYSPFGYSGYFGNYDAFGFNNGFGYNNYYNYNNFGNFYNPYQTGRTNVTTVSNKYYAPRNSGGAIREVTGPNGQTTTGRRGDVGNGNINPTRNNTPARADVKKETMGDGGITPRNSGSITPTKRYDPISSDGRTEGVTDRPTRTTERPTPSYDRPQRTDVPNTDRPTRTTERPTPNYDRPQRTDVPSNDRPTRTYERPAPNYDRPQRTEAPSNDRPTRTYERPAPNYDRPQRMETPHSEPTRSTPRYEAPRQESRSYEAPRQESRSYSPPANNNSSAPAAAPSRSENNNSSSTPRRGN